MPFDDAPDTRQWTGLANFHDGLAAEDGVARWYESQGAKILTRRWRGKAGEIDLVARDSVGFIFIEVKKGRTHGAAAGHLSTGQLGRICRAADEYLGIKGHGLSSNVRIDLATADRSGTIEVLENVSLF